MNDRDEVEIDSKLGTFKVSGKAKTVVIVVAIIATIFFCSMGYDHLLLFFLFVITLIIALSILTFQHYLYHNQT